jgi:hypothetical protein
LKIDRAFIDIERIDGSARIVKAIIDLGHGIQLKVTSEGVETQAEWDVLSEMGNDAVQPHLRSRYHSTGESGGRETQRGACCQCWLEQQDAIDQLEQKVSDATNTMLCTCSDKPLRADRHVNRYDWRRMCHRRSDFDQRGSAGGGIVGLYSQVMASKSKQEGRRRNQRQPARLLIYLSFLGCRHGETAELSFNRSFAVYRCCRSGRLKQRWSLKVQSWRLIYSQLPQISLGVRVLENRQRFQGARWSQR